MDNSEVIDEINNWQVEIVKPDFNNKLIELAFFKIFVKFEKFLSQIFIHYSIGRKSSMRYRPKRKLSFNTTDQLYVIIKGNNRNFIDIPKLIKSISPHIFKENDDPFFLLFSDPTFADNYQKMQYIRNYIAHESDESKNKYISGVLNTFNINSFIEASDFLLKNNRLGESYYTMFIDIIKQFSNVLINPGPFLSQTTFNHQIDQLP